MKPGKRRRIGLLTKERGADGTVESEQETQETGIRSIVDEGDAITVTFGGDTEDELEDELEDDDVDTPHSSMETSPLTTKVLIR